MTPSPNKHKVCLKKEEKLKIKKGGINRCEQVRHLLDYLLFRLRDFMTYSLSNSTPETLEFQQDLYTKSKKTDQVDAFSTFPFGSTTVDIKAALTLDLLIVLANCVVRAKDATTGSYYNREKYIDHLQQNGIGMLYPLYQTGATFTNPFGPFPLQFMKIPSFNFISDLFDSVTTVDAVAASKGLVYFQDSDFASNNIIVALEFPLELRGDSGLVKQSAAVLKVPLKAYADKLKDINKDYALVGDSAEDLELLPDLEVGSTPVESSQLTFRANHSSFSVGQKLEILRQYFFLFVNWLKSQKSENPKWYLTKVASAKLDSTKGYSEEIKGSGVSIDDFITMGTFRIYDAVTGSKGPVPVTLASYQTYEKIVGDAPRLFPRFTPQRTEEILDQSTRLIMFNQSGVMPPPAKFLDTSEYIDTNAPVPSTPVEVSSTDEVDETETGNTGNTGNTRSLGGQIDIRSFLYGLHIKSGNNSEILNNVEGAVQLLSSAGIRTLQDYKCKGGVPQTLTNSIPVGVKNILKKLSQVVQ